MNIITLGRWPQNSSQPEPVQWLVLREEENALLCLSRVILDCQPYHREGGGVCWKDCSLRRWLDQEFLPAAFTPEEQRRLLPARLKSPGGETTDRVFLLAPPEDWPGWDLMKDSDSYFSFPPEDCAITTPYTREKGIWFVEEEGPD